ncbi:maltokinase N-terminal cap-like domain-containing protein [Mycolicibacterium sp. Dal123E01]|uniref:maltokinase N-terminal cap-like domain-containing protein n=1 Tax=Mycolicibacterium sp. Dal123E01 TaxID=3457578 RepID=UPI00403E9CCD
MAFVHRGATLSPSKPEIVGQWLAATDWFHADPEADPIAPPLAYRFDDPAGKVGIEGLIVPYGGRYIQLPLTYREAPLAGADEWLLTTMEHSALGRRWVYDGVGDPVLVTAFISSIAGGTSSAILEFDAEDERRTAPTSVHAHGTGSGPMPTPLDVVSAERTASVSTVHTTAGVLRIPHLLDPAAPASSASLVGDGDALGSTLLLAEFIPG